jgi:hypothetical protein
LPFFTGMKADKSGTTGKKSVSLGEVSAEKREKKLIQEFSHAGAGGDGEHQLADRTHA